MGSILRLKRYHFPIFFNSRHFVLTTRLQLESIYRSCAVVVNICVYASPDQSKPVAIIVPAEPALKSLATQHGISGSSLTELVHSKKLNGIVLSEMQKSGKEGGLSGIEIIDGLVMADEEWTPQNVSIVLLLLSYHVLQEINQCGRIW